MSEDRIAQQSLLEQYGNCQTDVALLKMLLKAYADDPKTLGMGMEQVISRSIDRAERELYDIKQRYENWGER